MVFFGWYTQVCEGRKPKLTRHQRQEALCGCPIVAKTAIPTSGAARMADIVSLFPQELSIRNLLNRYTAKHGIILEVLLDKTVVRGPTHLGRFRRNPPVIQIR